MHLNKRNYSLQTYGICLLMVLLGVVTVIGGIKLFAAQEVPTQKEEQEIIATLLDEADNLHQQGSYEDAINVYKRILEMNSNTVDIYGRIAHIYRYWHKFDESEEWFLKALEKDPDNFFLRTDLGKLYRNMGRYTDAEAAFKKSLEINPNYSNAYSYGLGFLYFEQKKYSESEAMFLKALELNPTSEVAYMGLGDLYREMGRYQESESMYQKAFQINPSSESYLGLGWLYIYEGRYEEAEEVLLAFLKNIREKGEVYYTLGQVYLKMERYEDAHAAFKQGLQLTPDDPFLQKAFDDVTRSIE